MSQGSLGSDSRTTCSSRELARSSSLPSRTVWSSHSRLLAASDHCSILLYCIKFHIIENMKQIQLHIGDICVAFGMALSPSAPLKRLAELCCRSIGEVHNAERRLRAGRLLKPSSREVEREPLMRFVRWGVPHAFPATVGPLSRGIATACLPTAPGAVDPPEAEFVWPDPLGRTRGQALAPPYRGAPRLSAQSPELKGLVSLLDLVRVGGTREQAAAVDEIGRRMIPNPG